MLIEKSEIKVSSIISNKIQFSNCIKSLFYLGIIFYYDNTNFSLDFHITG